VVVTTADYAAHIVRAKNLIRQVEREAAAKMYQSAAFECGEAISELRAVLEDLARKDEA